MAEAENVPMHSTFMDYPEHERTYRSFTFAAKWGTVAIAAIVILMAIFLI
jgi:hypothetical protein